MKCYNHPQAEAVAICKNCAKGLCAECAADTGVGIACKNHCEEEVKSQAELMNRNKKNYKRISSLYFRLAFIMGAIGGYFLIYDVFIEKETDMFMLPMGIIFLLTSVFVFMSAMKFRKK